MASREQPRTLENLNRCPYTGHTGKAPRVLNVVSTVSRTNSELRRGALGKALVLGMELARGPVLVAPNIWSPLAVTGAPCLTLKTWLRQEEVAGEDFSRSGQLPGS